MSSDARAQRRAEAARNARAEAAAAQGRQPGVIGRPSKRARGSGDELMSLNDDEAAMVLAMRRARTFTDDGQAAEWLEQMLQKFSTSELASVVGRLQRVLDARSAVPAADATIAAAQTALPSWGRHAARNSWEWMWRVGVRSDEPESNDDAFDVTARLRQLGLWEGGECITHAESVEEYAIGRQRRHSI